MPHHASSSCILTFTHASINTAVFEELKCTVEWKMEEGETVNPGPEGKVIVAIVTGKARNVLLGERTALNILTRASGVATEVR